MTNNNNCVDIIIVGSGIAGLYAGYQIKRIAPANTTFLILEKNPKKWMGGRAGNETFYGADVVVGAGVGRKNKDHVLIQLLKDTKTPYSEFKTTRNYATFQPVDIIGIVRELKDAYKKDSSFHRDKTFKQFFIDVLGAERYKEFVITTGYTDFEDADLYETLYHYGMDDNVSGWTALHVPWSDLIERLYKRIDCTSSSSCIRFSTEVSNIEQRKDSSGTDNDAKYRFEITTTNTKHKKYYANKVIVATTIQGIRKIVPGASSPSSIYQHIKGQPFLIVYAKFDRISTEIMKKYVQAFTVVRGPLQKLIPMDPDKGVYMIAYTDNQRAMALKSKDALENTPIVREMYSKWMKQALGIPDKEPPLNIIAIRDYYWNDGTHYYTPIHRTGCKSRPEFIRIAQHPMTGMVVVGEVVSRHQGWVEGALESVNAVVTREWLQL